MSKIIIDAQKDCTGKNEANDKLYDCPECEETIKEYYNYCRHCGAEIKWTNQFAEYMNNRYDKINNVLLDIHNLLSEQEKIGNRLKQERISKGLTIKELSKKIGYSEAQISRIERGVILSVSSEFLKKMSKYFNLDYNYLCNLYFVTKIDNNIDLLYKGDIKNWIKARNILLDTDNQI